MDANEEMVRAAWVEVDFFGPSGDGCHVAITYGGSFYGNIPCNAWAAAAVYTRERQEQIRQLEEEIETMHLLSTAMGYAKADGILPTATARYETCKRILSRLEAELAKLQQGVRTRVTT